MKMNQDMDKIKVLLVEDEQTLAMIIKDTLEGQNSSSILLPCAAYRAFLAIGSSMDDEVWPSSVSLIIMARVCSSSTSSTLILSIS